MTEISASSLQERQGPFARFHRAVTSFVLIMFTGLVGLSCLIALSSTLTQTRISSIAVNGVPLSIWKIDDIRRQWAEVRGVMDMLSTRIVDAELSRAGHTAVTAAAEQEYRAKQTELIMRLGEITFRLRALDPELAKTLEGTTDTIERYALLGAAQSRLLAQHAEIKPFLDVLDGVFADYGQARGKRLATQSRSEAIINEILALQKSVEGSRNSLETLVSQISPGAKLDDSTRSRVESALYEFISMGGVFGRLATINPDTLTLILVIIMGVLGSSLQMTYALLRQHRLESVGTYCLRVCVGAITALVIFIVAKAGVPIIADASRLGGDASINPYFVSFLAIISGLMSENAILSVQTQGARFFGPDGASEPKRWARQDLREAFATSNRDPERVKKLVQASDDEFEGWVSGKEPIPPNVQMIIAGVLQIPPRDLYTDIPPDQAGTTS